MQLTIAIPTYNRPRQLKTTVQLLLPQLTQDTEITIVDNASSIPVTLDSLQVPPSHQGKVKIIRNRFNIGLIGNIIRCLEICETQYVWVLGDDDFPSEHCIATISTAIENAPEATSYSFNETNERKSYIISHGQKDFIQRIDNWAGVLSLSNNVYSAIKMQSCISAGYEYGYSYAPQVAVLLEALRVGDGDVVFSPDQIILGNQAGTDNPWSAVTFIQRRFAILDLPMDPSMRLCLGRKITSFAGDLNSPFLYFVSDSCKDHSDTMEDIINRSYRYLSIKGKLKALLFRVLIHFPRVSWFLIVRFFPKDSISYILDREAKAKPTSNLET